MERGDVVFAAGPFKEDSTTSRPFLLINRTETPFHGEQSITLSLTARTWQRTNSAHECTLARGWRSRGKFDNAVISEFRDVGVDHLSTRALTEDIVNQAVAQLREYVE